MKAKFWVNQIRRWQAAHTDVRAHIQAWYKIARAAHWTSFQDVKAQIPTVDQYKCCLIFNIAGNRFRLICRVDYAREDYGGVLFMKRFMTHTEYEKRRWHEDCKSW